MTVLNGEVKTTINIRGVGDGAARVDAASKAIKGTETAAKGAGSSFLSMREKLAQVAGMADSAFGKMTGQVGVVASTAVEAGTIFGALGVVVGGVAAAVAGVVAAAFDLEQQRFDLVTKSLQGTADAAGRLAQSLATAAVKAKELQEAAKAAEVRDLTAQIATARARGDTTSAAGLAGRLTLLQSGNEVGALRAQGSDAFFQSANATVQRAAALAQVADTEAKIRTLEGKLAQKAVVEFRNGIAMSREDLQAELAGLQALRVQQVGNAALVSPQAAGQNVAAATALFKAAESVQTQGLVESATGVLSNAVDVLKASAGGVKPGGGGGSGGRSTGAVDPRAALRAAFLSGDQAAIDAAFARDSGKGLAANDNQLVGALTQGDAQAKSAQQVADYSEALNRADLAGNIRDFTAALGEAMPGMSDFSAALAQIGDIWAKWAETGKNTKAAVVGSLAAIAVAGAQQIKDERARAGVLAIIETGLGFANLENPAIAAGHFTAAAVLGGVALFGAGGSARRSGGGSAASAASSIRPVNDNTGVAPVQLNINAPWFGPSPQEAAAGLAAFLGSANGTGFGAAA